MSALLGLNDDPEDSSEWRQIKRIATIFDPKYVQKKAIHQKHHKAPREYGKLLSLWIRYSRNFKTERNGGEGEYTV